MADASWGLQNITANNGVPIAITGMVIVFAALSFISLFISLLPRIMEVVNEYLPPEEEPAVTKGGAASSEDETLLALAIGYALYQEEMGTDGQD